MGIDEPAASGGDQPTNLGAGQLPRRAWGAWPAYWFPLLLFGLLTALSVPVSQLWLPPSTGFAMLVRDTAWSEPQAFYLGSGPDAVGGFPMGWYWTAALVAGLLLTVAWYRWHDRRTGGRTRMRGFLVTGLALTGLAAAAPLGTVGAPPSGPPWTGPGPVARVMWTLAAQWTVGLLAFGIIVVSLGVLAWAERSRALGVIALIYCAPVVLGELVILRNPELWSIYLLSDVQVRPSLVPAAVLLVAGLTVLAARTAVTISRGRRTA